MKNIRPWIYFDNTWKFKDFKLGINIWSWDNCYKRSSGISFEFGFWTLNIGFDIITSPDIDTSRIECKCDKLYFKKDE